MEDRKRLLAKLELFAGLSDAELDAVARLTRRRRLHAGEALFHKGDDGSEIGVVVGGRLKAFASGPDGGERLFRFMDANDVIGELAVFAEVGRTANVVAVEDSELLVIHRRELIPLLRRCPEIAIRLLAALAKRMIENSEWEEDKDFRPVNERLARCLLRLAKRWSEADGEGRFHITVRLPQSDLGDLIGATRESVNKTIKKWSDASVVSMRDGAISVLDRAALEAEAEGANASPPERAPARSGGGAAAERGRARPSPAAKRRRPRA